MQTPVAEQPKKVVRVIAPTITPQEQAKKLYRQLRVVAYCRVSTKQEVRINHTVCLFPTLRAKRLGKDYRLCALFMMASLLRSEIYK